jgi:signal transduction histidine kinase
VVEGGGGESLEGVRLARDTGIAGWVATHQKPLIVDDVNTDNRYYQSIAASFAIKLTSLLCVPMVLHSKLIGVLQVFRTQPEHYFGLVEEDSLTTFASKAAIAIENARLYETLKEERDKLLAAEDEIRKHLARELHDGPTQLVAAISMNMTFIKELMKLAPHRVEGEIDKTMDLADQTMKQLRTLLFDLRPVILETQGLVPALEVYLERFQEAEEIETELMIKDKFERLSARAEIAIFSIIQEALNNIKKYAQASRLDLLFEIRERQNWLIISIKDDGQGFDVQKVKAGYDKKNSFGLLNMQERAAALAGSLEINSTLGQGTQVILSLPLIKNLRSNVKEK